jgi:hypothetical protein
LNTGNLNSDTNAICADNDDHKTPCPNGYCQLISNGGSSFDRRCVDPNVISRYQLIQIFSNVVGDTEPESVFTYHCKTHMCNSNETAEKVRKLLKEHGLLTPTGVLSGTPDTSGQIGAAVALFSSTSTVIQCILILTTTLFFKV